MKKGFLIAVEGTDCSGKETQVNMLISHLKELGYRAEKFNFPKYETPTGKIVGGPYLGKPQISKGLFEEGASNVDPYVASLYFAADRRYNKKTMEKLLNEGVILISDRYVDSNLGHQMSKIDDHAERQKFYKFITNLEYKMLGMPKADVSIFLHMPTEQGQILASKRDEPKDEHESDIDFLLKSELTYLEIAKKHKYKVVECVKNDKILTIENISQKVCEIVSGVIAKKLKKEK